MVYYCPTRLLIGLDSNPSTRLLQYDLVFVVVYNSYLKSGGSTTLLRLYCTNDRSFCCFGVLRRYHIAIDADIRSICSYIHLLQLLSQHITATSAQLGFVWKERSLHTSVFKSIDLRLPTPICFTTYHTEYTLQQAVSISPRKCLNTTASLPFQLFIHFAAPPPRSPHLSPSHKVARMARVNEISSGVEFAEDGSLGWISEGGIENPSGGRWTGVFFNPEGFNPLDSQLYLTVDGGSHTAYMHISTALVPESYVHILCTHLHHLVTSTAHSVHTLSILNPSPRHLPGPTLLHNLITFSTHDNLPALEFLHSNSSRGTYSYADLDILSTQFALKLLPHTTPTQRLIPVLLPQSPALYIALIGILKAGCAFVPLPLDAPPQRLQFIVDDIKAPCIVCDPASPPVPNLPCVTPDEETPTFSLASLMELPTTISPSDAAYVMYTSGTTGTPKGVLVSHYAAAQSLLAQDVLVPRSVGRWLQQAAPTFDVFVFEMFFPLMRGIVLVGCERAVMLRDLPGVVRRMDVDVVELTPTVAGGLLGKREDIPGLKCLLTIGEMLTKGVVDMWRDVLVGMYGPTEAAIHCTASTAVERVGDIGIPFETVSAFVVAPYKGGEIEVLPVGCVGELVVGGPQLADGYINRPETTREVFINSARFGRLYRTGDRARVLPSGGIECLGRIGAGQVKMHGQRIELGEIEEVVLKTPGVKACVANVIKNTLVIWVGGATSKLEIVETCKKWLPAYMIPGDILILPTLPRLASGKADRKLLEADYKSRVIEAQAAPEVMNATERVIAHEASLLLGAAPGKDVSLVSRGLDSMQAIRLAIALRKRGLEVETVDVIRSDTISAIVAGIEKNVGALRKGMNAPVQKQFEEVAKASKELHKDRSVLKVIPCTSVQAAMLAETAQDSAAYCNWMLLSLPPNQNATTVEAAVRRIIDANEILRTGFVVLGGGFAQVVYRTSHPSQFSLSNRIQEQWSVTVPQLLLPPFRVALVNGQLSVQIHHALYDGWCWDNIMSDLAAHLDGRAVAPRPQYQIVVEREIATDNSSSIDHWRKTLSGVEPVSFPCLTGKSDVVNEVRQEIATMSVGKEAYDGAARRFGVAPVVLVQAAWAVLWSTYVGESDVVVGNVLSGRTAAMEGIEDVIGPMIVTVPVRVDVRRQRSVKEVVSEVAKRGREVLGNELGLREVKKAWGGEGRLFESLLVWQQQTLASEGSVKIVDLKDMLEFPILLEVTPGTADISLRVTYQTSILPPAHAALILTQLDQFVTSIISHPEQTLTALLQSLPPSSLSIENPHSIIPSMSSTPSLSHLVELAASRNPNEIAIDVANDIVGTTTKSTTLNYHTFNTQANKLAYHLLSLGAKPDTLISICMEKSPILYISILAILKSGAAYAPITPETPNERKNQIIESADVRIHLTTSDLAPELSGLPQSVKVVCVDMVNTVWYSEANPDVQRCERDLAYAVFTSGSTGKPKGVLVENYAIVDHIRQLRNMYPAALGKRLLQFCTVAFDVSVFELFFTWAMGMTLCVARKDLLLRDIEGAINAFKITHLSMTPTVAALVNPDNVPSVEFLVTAGESVNRKVFESWTGRGFWTGYGPSEMVNICAVRPNLRKEDHINTLGETFANTSAFVISQDEDELCLLPRGAVGELCFGGAQVARGYLKQPELTAQKFPTHPIYGRVYRSGDIGRLLSDGSLEFIGRIDDQVKIRGLRIELGEITSVLLRSAAVLDAAAVPVRKSSADPYQLVAFVLLASHRNTEFSVVKADQRVRETLSVLFKALSGSLPEYMVPTVLLPVTTIPMTGTGKIDKKVLAKTYFGLDTAVIESYSEESGKAGDTEWMQVEMEIVRFVADVAQVTVGEIGRGTSIFKLGLDSISVIQLSNRIMSAGYKRLDVSQIMKNPTVGALAALLEEKNEGPATTTIVRGASLNTFAESVKAAAIEQLGVAPEEIMKILPCSPLQEAMLTQKKGVDVSTYYNHTVLHLKANPSRLKKAWEVVAERHDIMRTCFCVTEDSRHAYAQVVLKKHDLPWTTFDVEATQERIDQRISEISASMSINRVPYAFSLFAGETLVMSFHHSLYDGFAMGLLLDDVRSAYLGLELPIRRPFDRVLEYMEDIDLEASDAFWKDLLTGFEASPFPDLTGKTALFKEETKLIGMTATRMTCSKTLSEIEEGCRNISTSLLALGQTGWARLLAAYSGETDVCFGSIVSGRTIPVEGVEDVIAPCFNSVPLRVQLTPGATNLSVMNSIRSLNADILPYQLTPLRRIMNTLKTEGQGLFDTLFILQYANEASTDLWEEVDDCGEMDFSIVVELVPNRNRNSLDIVLYFRRNVVLEEQVEVMVQQLNAAIIDSLQYPDELAVNFQAFDPSILAKANSKPLKLEDEGYDLLHSDFERHARENPSRVALEFLDNDGKTTSWTFRQLNEAANRVAHYLVSLGLKRDEAVPLSLEKSPLFYICILGVLKAGCAFTPIDPTLPEQRKMFMVEELGARVVLVTAATAGGMGRVAMVDVESGVMDSQPITNLSIRDLTPRCLAYRLYTSGSTGQPKAVSLEIKSAVQTFRSSKPLIPWKPDSRLLQFAATTFDMCYYDCFMAWSYGFTLCSAAKKHLLGDLEGTIKTMKATLLDLTPTVAATLVAENLMSVEMLYCIGEAMPQKVVNDWDGRCVNSYGPTEAAMCCTITATNRHTKSSNIGEPFPTASFFVLSRGGEYIVPIFGSGELCIGGPQVAREYHNNVQLTKRQFIQLDGDTVYRTGDLVRMLGDGTFEFIGRADDQVKIRGLRVELDEISSVLRGGHRGVKDATTIVAKHGEGAKEQLVSFLAVEGRKQHGTKPKLVKTGPQTEEIQSAALTAAKAKLPRYMIPAVILIIDHVPRSAAGKVDKKALGVFFREQDIQSFGAAIVEEDESVWTEEEKKIRSVFSLISRVPVGQISRASTIYEIGLDSISAAQVAMQLKRVGLEISVLDILERPSIKQLSKFITDGNHAETNSQPSEDYLVNFSNQFMDQILKDTGIAKDRITGVFPCTPAQEGMLSQFLRSKGGLYFNHSVFKLPQDVNLTRLRESWNAVFGSHDMLRAGFVEVEHNTHAFATIIYGQGSIDLPWTIADSREDDNVLSTQKELGTARALENIHLPPWGVTVIRERNGGSLLLFSAHHALFDAEALGIFLEDVFSEYSGNRVAPRPKFSAVLSNIVKHSLDAKVIEEDKTFWLKQLEGTSISRFPNLCPVRIKSTSSHVCSIETSWSLSKIESGCRKLGISVNVAGQAAWARVLSAYMGDNAVTTGIVLSGRSGVAGAENVAFPCITTVPSLCLLTGTNLELALALQRSNAQTLKHQHTPLRNIQGWFDHRQESFFDSIFVYQKTASSRKNSWEVVEENAFVDYTISLEIEPTNNDSLLIRATCRENVMPKEQTQLLIQQVNAALVDILQNPNSSSTEFLSFPPELLSCTPPVVDEIPTDITLLHKFVEKYRKLTPNKIAFEFATSIQKGCAIKETWTYSQLDEEGNRIANYLLNLGVKTGQIIAICFEKCPEASFAILGILKAGCAFMALDYNAPIDRKAFIVEDSGAKCVLTMDKYAQELRSKVKVGVVSLESDAEVKISSSKTPFIADLKPEDLCYCLYTSGTTGTPKGCELTHENAVQAMLAFQRIFDGHWDSESRFLQFASFHFDVSVMEQYFSWSVGMCVTSAPRDVIFQDLALTINELQITHLDLTPSLAALLRPEDCPSLCRGVFITGGEQLKQEILNTWGETGAIYNGYGPTEVTIGCTMYARVPANGKPSNIGTAFDNVGSFVLTPNTSRPVLRGAIGELCVSGKLVGRGYLKRAALTEEKFPHLKEFDTRIYRTGDLVRILYDGTFDFAGRADDQVKLRGQRLEIGEINETLKQADPRVKAVATLVLRHPKQQKDQLVSFIVLGTAKASSTSDPVVLDDPEHHQVIPILADGCRRKLPVYMVPTHFLPISKMPLSVNNKVDNKKLTAIYQETSLALLQQISRREESSEENWTDGETRIRKILAEMTGFQISEIKRSSTVFELGLDSVSVVGLARRLKKDGFFASSVSLVMKYPGVKQLAAELSKGDNNSSQELARTGSINQKITAFANKGSFEVCERLGLEPDQIEAIVPCTALQEGMILRFIDSEKPLYYNSFSFSLEKSTDTNTLRSAWNSVVKSTGVLRTCFCETSDGYAQVVLRSSEAQWREISIKSENIQSVITNEMTEHVDMNRDLHQTPLYLLLLRTPSRVILVVNIFHALYDGNSLSLIFQDVQRAYRNQLKPRPHQFHEIVRHILSVDIDGARKFWKSTLAEAKPSTFPQLTQSAADTDHLAQLKPKIAIEDVEKCCKKLNCTPQSVFQAAWSNTLSPYLGPQFAFGVVVSGRSLPTDGVEDTIGPMFNTIPCSLDVKNASSWEKLVQQAHRFNSESIAYHHTPLRLINKLMRVTSENPLFDTLFVYQKDLGGDDTTEATIWNVMDSSAVADYPLALEIEESHLNGLNFSIVAKNSVLTTDKSLELLNNLERNIKEILQNPLSKPSLEKTPESDPIVSKESTNGTHANGQAGFQWGSDAKILRSTIAKLADVGESEVDEDSSIFELGLDSIEAIKLSSRLRSSGIKLSVSTIMRNPTIRKMHDVLSQSAKGSKILPKANRLAEFEQHVRQSLKGRKHDLDLDEIEAIYPATPLQEGIIAETLASDYKLYFNHDVLELDPTVDIRQLRNAWEVVFQNSEILRTSFFRVSELSLDFPYMFGQAVHKRPQLKWKEVLVTSNAKKAIKAAMLQSTQDIDMLQEPPLQITIVKSPKRNYLILSMSHALYDGWSLGLLHEDVQNAYLDSPSARPSCRALLEDIFSVDPKDSSKFWKQMLAGASPSMFQTSVENFPATTHRFERPSALPFWRIQSFCKQMGVTVQSLGQMCWALLLAHHLGEPDVLFGTVLSGRDIESADKMIFPAMNTVPVRAIAHGDYKDMLRYMQDNSARVLKYQHTPLRQIQRLVGSQGQRLFDTLFIYQRGREPSESSQKPLWNSVDGDASVEYNICIEMEHCGDNLVWRNACKSTVLSEIDSESLLQTLDSLLVHIVNNTDHPAMVHQKDGVSFGNIPMRARHSDTTASLNGLRIDLNETASKIKEAQSNTGDTAAIVANDNGRQLLVIFITGEPSIVQSLASFARHEFPHWSMPSFIIPVSTLPHKNGKIDRARLESHFHSMKPEDRDEFAVQEKNGEWTPLELTFRRILSAVSHLPEAEIERTQTIFHLGLDSISAIGFSSKLREQSIFLSVAEILRAATIERMAAVAKTMNRETPKAPVDTEKVLEKALVDINLKSLLGGISEASIESVAPATAGQVYMLSAWKNSNYTIFMPTFTFRCRKIEHSRILSAWESLTRQESILRTTFLATDSEDTPLVQVVLRNPPAQTEWYQSSTASNDSFIEFLKSQEQRKPVNLEQPPVRLTIFTTPVETIIFLTIHHALYDGVSLPLLLSKFQGFLKDNVERLPTPEPEAPRFLDFVTFTRSQDVQQQSRFWSKYLDGAASTLTPLKYPDVQTTERTELFRTGVIDESKLLESRCRAEGVSLQSVFLAAYAKVHAYHVDLKDGPVKKKEDVVFGIYLSNRHLPISDLAAMAAPTLNVVPLRVRSPRTTTLVQLARQVQTDLTEIGGAGNGTVGLWQVEKWTGVRVDCFVNYLKMPGGDEVASGDDDDVIGLEDMNVDVKSNIGAARAQLPEKAWMDSAKTHLDIEVAVRGDKVDIGVFSTAQSFNREDADNTIEWMREIAMGVL